MALFNFRRKALQKAQVRSDAFYSYIVNSSPVVLYNYNQHDFIKKGYAENAEVYSIVKKITDKANIATPYIYIDKEGTKSKKHYLNTKGKRDNPYNYGKHKVEVHKALEFADYDNDLARLLQQPNTKQTWRELITLFRIFYQVQGEAFLIKESGDDGCALSIEIAPAHLMTPIRADRELIGWELDLLNGKQRKYIGDDLKDVLHFKMPNPIFDQSFTQFRGMSPLLAGLKYLQLDDKALLSWIKSVENEGAKGIVSPNHANPELWLTPEQVEATQKAVEEKIHGSDNKNKIAVSGMPLQYTHIGLSPDALNIIKGLEHASYKLCDLWGVPAALFDPTPTYKNQETASERFVKEVILPYLNAEEDKLNSWLVEPFKIRDKKEYVLDYDLSSFEELRLSPSETDAMLKTHTINEVRVMLGSDELQEEYANQVFITQGMIPLSDYSIDSFVN